MHGRIVLRARATGFAANAALRLGKQPLCGSDEPRLPHRVDRRDVTGTLRVNEAAIEMHQQHERTSGRRNARHLADGIEPGVLDAELARGEIERAVGEEHVGCVANDRFHVRHAIRQALHRGA